MSVCHAQEVINFLLIPQTRHPVVKHHMVCRLTTENCSYDEIYYRAYMASRISDCAFMANFEFVQNPRAVVDARITEHMIGVFRAACGGTFTHNSAPMLGAKDKAT